MGCGKPGQQLMKHLHQPLQHARAWCLVFAVCLLTTSRRQRVCFQGEAKAIGLDRINRARASPTTRTSKGDFENPLRLLLRSSAIPLLGTGSPVLRGRQGGAFLFRFCFELRLDLLNGAALLLTRKGHRMLRNEGPSQGAPRD
jgi:hypothetical protein